MSVNAARGEVAVTVGGQALTLLVTPDALCRFSTAIGAKTFRDVVAAAIGGEPVAVREAIKAFTAAGDGDKAWADIRLTEFVTFAEALSAALTAHMDEAADPGNPSGEGPEKPGPSPRT